MKNKYYRQYRNNKGYMLLIDFIKFFYSVQYEKLIEEYSKRITDKEALNLIIKITKKPNNYADLSICKE